MRGFTTDELGQHAHPRSLPEFIRGLRDLGYDRVAVDDLVNMRIHA